MTRHAETATAATLVLASACAAAASQPKTYSDPACRGLESARQDRIAQQSGRRVIELPTATFVAAPSSSLTI
jgi:hypothetical protein